MVDDVTPATPAAATPAAAATPVSAVAAVSAAAAAPASMADPAAAAVAAEAAGTPEAVAAEGWDVTKLGEGYVKDGKPDFDAITAALGKVHVDMPAEDATYDLSFGEGFDIKGEDGEIAKIDPADPRVADMTTWARENGIGQKAVSGLMAIYGNIIKDAHGQNSTGAAERMDAEWAKLDPDKGKAQERATKAANGIYQALGKENAALSSRFIDAMADADMVKFTEIVLDRIGGEGAASPTAADLGTSKVPDAKVFFDHPTSQKRS